MGNVGATRCRPLSTWLAGCWLFFDQVLLRDHEPVLSTFLLAGCCHPKAFEQPVDKSVVKLWKDCAKQRNCWLGAIACLTDRSR
ncbi:hypothetical protein C1886_15640 [Pseudomonas sp. FW300-N1A1]|nr:hypothetical protein C1886_15640 [Pseudomonas sp. FW300-N1A1]